MACGNNKVTRDYVSSPPAPPESALIAIHARLPKNEPGDRLKADVWISTKGEFVDQPKSPTGPRQHEGVTTPGANPLTGRPEPKFLHRSDPKDKQYTHLTGSAGWLGPQSLLDRLPVSAQVELNGRRVIVLKPNASDTWVNERGSVRDSRGRLQTTVVRRPK